MQAKTACQNILYCGTEEVVHIQIVLVDDFHNLQKKIEGMSIHNSRIISLRKIIKLPLTVKNEVLTTYVGKKDIRNPQAYL
jgi:hypothetical protein